MNFFEIVGRNILDILNEQGKTQSYLADEIGISKQVMQKIIKGKKAINILEITQIADVLNVSVDILTKKVDDVENSLVMFMGEVKNKEQFDFLNKVIEEIVSMEEDLDEQMHV